MEFVLDASTALNLILSEEQRTSAAKEAAAAFTRGDTAQVPSLWLLEVANALITSERRGRIESGAGDRLLEKLLALPIGVATEAFGGERRTSEVLQLARAQGLTAYDAAYLGLAQIRGLPLASGDAALRRAARASSVPTLGD